MDIQKILGPSIQNELLGTPTEGKEEVKVGNLVPDVVSANVTLDDGVRTVLKDDIVLDGVDIDQLYSN